MEIPRHVAIIMDGNGRWAKKQGLPRFRGHLEGVRRLEEVAEAAHQRGIKVLTVFAFSTENWRRPKREVAMLMNTLCTVLEQRLRRLVKNDIRLFFIGDRAGIPEKVLRCLDTSMEQTRDNQGLVLNLAFNYGARQEIVSAVRAIAREVQAGRQVPDEIDEQVVSRALYTRDLPDPDLLIRTSGEHRISNFLLWQAS